MFYGHHFVFRHNVFVARLNLLPDFSIGIDSDTSQYTYRNTRGIQLTGNITDKFFFNSTVYENQARFHQPVRSFIADTGVVPGETRVKNFREDGSVDFELAMATVGVMPADWINVTAGFDKHFYGFGYRSMLWSDVSAPYSNLTTNLKFGPVTYNLMWAALLNYRKGNVLGFGYERKYAAVHYLTVTIKNRIEVGLFESVVWPGRDSSAQRGFDVNYLNPIIFFHAVQNHLGSPDNSAIGLNLVVKATKSLHFYGQAFLDDLDIARSNQKGFYRNKFAWQAGARAFNIANVSNLNALVEFNQASPYTYAHKLPQESYTHYAQPLGHPAGANFREGIFILTYEYKRFFTMLKNTYLQVGLDTTGTHNGQNIFRSDYDIVGFPKSYNNKLLQGLKTDVYNASLTVGFLVNPVNRMTIELNGGYRSSNNSLASRDSYFISFGLRTNLFNRYYDY